MAVEPILSLSRNSISVIFPSAGESKRFLSSGIFLSGSRKKYKTPVRIITRINSIIKIAHFGRMGAAKGHKNIIVIMLTGYINISGQPYFVSFIIAAYSIFFVLGINKKGLAVVASPSEEDSTDF